MQPDDPRLPEIAVPVSMKSDENSFVRNSNIFPPLPLGGRLVRIRRTSQTKRERISRGPQGDVETLDPEV